MSEAAAAAALHALEPDQELAVREHLPSCASCRGAVRDAEIVARALAESVEQVDPPAHLRETVLAHAGSRPPRVAALRAAAARPAPTPPRAAPRPRPDRRRARRAFRPVMALAAAVLFAVAGLAGYTADLHRRLDVELARAHASTLLIDQLGLPGARSSTLRTDDGRAVAIVVTSVAGQTLLVTGLPRDDAARSTYVVWGIGTAAPQPVGTFDVADTDPGLRAMGAPPARPFLGYAISLEPGRRPPAGPTHVVATGHLSP